MATSAAGTSLDDERAEGADSDRLREALRVNVKRVDPRDQKWQRDDPTFRVYFWSRAAHGAVSDEYEVQGADVTEVLAWAEADPQHRAFTLYARHDDPSGVGLIRLAGEDPTSVR
jgi:hypothetical protein